jgi:hypothetical protein
MGQSGTFSTLEIDVEIPTEKIGVKPVRQDATFAKAATSTR